MSTHTPGPWEARASIPAEGVDCFWIGPWEAKIAVATVDGPQSSKFRGANARLIAAAPDLLAALKELVGPQFDTTDAPCHRGICTAEKCGRCGREMRARAAIAKAETPP